MAREIISVIRCWNSLINRFLFHSVLNYHVESRRFANVLHDERVALLLFICAKLLGRNRVCVRTDSKIETAIECRVMLEASFYTIFKMNTKEQTKLACENHHFPQQTQNEHIFNFLQNIVWCEMKIRYLIENIFHMCRLCVLNLFASNYFRRQFNTISAEFLNTLSSSSDRESHRNVSINPQHKALDVHDFPRCPPLFLIKITLLAGCWASTMFNRV